MFRPCAIGNCHLLLWIGAFTNNDWLSLLSAYFEGWSWIRLQPSQPVSQLPAEAIVSFTQPKHVHTTKTCSHNARGLKYWNSPLRTRYSGWFKRWFLTLETPVMAPTTNWKVGMEAGASTVTRCDAKDHAAQYKPFTKRVCRVWASAGLHDPSAAYTLNVSLNHIVALLLSPEARGAKPSRGSLKWNDSVTRVTSWIYVWRRK